MMIKNLLRLSCFIFLYSAIGFSQVLDPVAWETSVEKISDTEYDLISVAIIDDNWHLYSQDVPDGGPIPTTFSYNSGTTFKLEGTTQEEEGEVVDDPVFQMRIKYFGERAEFTQRITLLDTSVSKILGNVEFMVCDDQRCLPPDVIDLAYDLNPENKTEGNSLFQSGLDDQNSNFLEPVQWESSILKISDTEYDITMTAIIQDGWYMYSQEESEGLGPLPTYFEYKSQDGNYKLVGTTKEPEVSPKFDKVFQLDVKKFDQEVDFTQRISVTNPKFSTIEIYVSYQTCDDGRCIQGDNTFRLNLDGSVAGQKQVTIDARSEELSEALKLNVSGWDKYEEQSIEKKSNFTIFLLGFLGGLIALLTPCVFPMIPLTVSFFTKSSGEARKGLFNSVLYGFFIFLIYFLLSLPFHVLDSLDPGILNNISTNSTLNVIFFVIFLVFAFSFFGYFELTLPQSWSAKMDDKATKIGGVIGIFFMALTLAIVSFSCTGPILGGLLGSSLASDASAMQLTLGMSGFGLALALPFTLFAMFPKWLNSLPKSGGWLNTVKVVLGFIELALALKFLSNADLVEHWGLLKREVFIALWILIGLGLVLYLFGKIKFPHDGPLQKLSKGRLTTGLLFLAIVIYLIPGLTNTKYANLKLLSGFPPPLFYSLYEKTSDCPLDLNCHKDFDKGLTAAKDEGKPILLDFTGWACVNCRKMEEQVWSTSAVYDVLSEDYIIISLYVDDKKALPETEQFKYLRPNGTVKNIKTIGNKWETLQTINFQNNSQPFYVLLDHNMELLNITNAYQPDANAYHDWLKTGLDNFNSNTKSGSRQFQTAP